MRARYKQLCIICRKNHVLISSYRQVPICVDCSMKQISKPIEDEKFRKMFDIDQKLYESSSFLRSIKSNYLRFGALSEKQIEMFKKVAAEIKGASGKVAAVELSNQKEVAGNDFKKEIQEPVSKPKAKAKQHRKAANVQKL